MNFVNLLPYGITLVFPSGQILVLKNSTNPCSVDREQILSHEIDTIPVWENVCGEIRGLPKEKEGNVYITTPMVAKTATLQGRTDVFTPFTGTRDTNGRYITVTGLANGM